MNASDVDSGNANVKVGLEVHQQLATSHKLFCACPIMKSEQFPFSFERRLRPAQGETGRLDPAALFEFSKGRSLTYLWNPESSCLVEADEEPPHAANDEAVETALMVSLILHSEVVDEVHVMRKIVIDGSNTSGFQRTAVLGLGGHLDFEGAKVGVQSVTVEEDAARLMSEDGGSRTFTLDRLGVPLIEVALDPFTGSPEEVGRLALHLGRTLRSTGRVARGLGTIRQDLNVSVNDGKVVEVKGVQKLNLLPKVVSYEVRRQRMLAEVARRLGDAGVKSVRTQVCDASKVLGDTSSRLVQNLIKGGAAVACVSAGGLADLMGWEPWPNVRLGKEVAEVARANSLGGIIHSDEFEKQGISRAEEESLRAECGAGDRDALVLLAGPAATVERALPQVLARLMQAPKGVPDETRAATEGGETRYLRPRPGAQRMYPETDIPDVALGEGRLRDLEKRRPDTWEDTVERLGSRYSLSRDLAMKLYDSDDLPLFEALAVELRLEPSVIASMLVDLPIRLAREGIPVETLEGPSIAEVLRAIDKGSVSKEAAPDILRSLGKGKTASVQEAIRVLGLGPMSKSELESVIDSLIAKRSALIKDRGEEAFSPLMGDVMAEVRGRADGGTVSKILRDKLERAVGQK